MGYTQFNATVAQDAVLAAKANDGPLTVLHLLRLRDLADYGDDARLAPDQPISGAEAFSRHIAHIQPHLEAAGAAITLLVQGGPLLIGPSDERWDVVMIIRHADVQSFFAMTVNEDYLAGLAHRMAALEDARLLPLVEPA